MGGQYLSLCSITTNILAMLYMFTIWLGPRNLGRERVATGVQRPDSLEMDSTLPCEWTWWVALENKNNLV